MDHMRISGNKPLKAYQIYNCVSFSLHDCYDDFEYAVCSLLTSSVVFFVAGLKTKNNEFVRTSSCFSNV